MSRRDDERVADILDAASEIAGIIGPGRDAWDKDRVRQLAVERLLEIIGESANSLSEEFRTRHPGIPWRDIDAARRPQMPLTLGGSGLPSRYAWQEATDS